MTGKLVLVDFDNFAPDEDALPLPVRAPRAGVEWLAWRPPSAFSSVTDPSNLPDCTVVIAMSTVTARRSRVSWEYVRCLGQELGRHLAGSPSVRTEVVLTLPAPQTADCALLRLCQDAPSKSAAGPTSAVWLVTADRDLIEQVTRILAGAGVVHTGSPSTNVHAFGHDGGERQHIRRFREPVATIARPTAPVEPRFSIDIDTPELAAWARSRDVDIPHDELDLPTIARVVERQPGLLSQIGITRQSVVGLERMVRLPAAMAMGSCTHQDGLEVCLAPPPDRHAHSRAVMRASVGSGAVRSADLGATLSTTLPYAVLDALTREHDRMIRVKANRAGIDDVSAIAALPDSACVGPTCRVTLRLAGPELRADVVAEGHQPPVAWWVTQIAKPRSNSKHRSLASLVEPGASYSVAARSRRLPRRRALVLASPLDGATRVEVRATIPVRRVGIGHTREGDPVAVLACRRVLLPGDHEVTPVQDIPAESLAILVPWLNDPARGELIELPIAVAGAHA